MLLAQPIRYALSLILVDQTTLTATLFHFSRIINWPETFNLFDKLVFKIVVNFIVDKYLVGAEADLAGVVLPAVCDALGTSGQVAVFVHQHWIFAAQLKDVGHQIVCARFRDQSARHCSTSKEN